MNPPAEGGPGSRPPGLPLLLLGLMTVASFAGPFLVALVFRGGEHQGWPPERPAEWWTLGGVSVVVVVLMAACLTVGLWSKSRPRV
jgi:drug/metabolite transporter (DMT)-like permease